MSLNITPHDRSFRKLFSDPEMVGQLMRQFLPEEVTARLALEALSPEDVAFVDDNLRNSQADLLFRTHLEEGGNALVYLLLEHKSSPEQWIGLDLVRYMVRIWKREIERNNVKDKLPPIIPMVFYHGGQSWDIPLNVEEQIEPVPGLHRYTLDMNYELINCANIPDNQLKDERPVGPVMLIFKHSFDPDFASHLDRWLKLIFNYIEPISAGERVFAMLEYLASMCDNVDKSQFQRKVIQACPQKGERIMTTVLEQWIEEGLQEGMQRGMEKGMEKGMKKGIEKGMEKGRKTGVEQGKREAIYDVIDSKFGHVPKDIRDLVDNVHEEHQLDAMLRTVARIEQEERLAEKLRQC